MYLFLLLILLAPTRAQYNDASSRAATERVGNMLRHLEQIRLNTTQSTNPNTALTSSGPCTCECNIRGFWEPLDYGYGKYCGAAYTCLLPDPKNPEAGCDPIDSCCRIHDLCVGAHGYCNSCGCNTALANCAGSVSQSDSGFCGKMSQAREGLLRDICYVLKHAPFFCGGCPGNDPLPSICAFY
jgi:hypothetical protein